MRALLCGLAESESLRWGGNQSFHGSRERLGISGINEQSGFVVRDDFGNPADVPRDAGAAETHRLQDAQTKAFRV